MDVYKDFYFANCLDMLLKKEQKVQCFMKIAVVLSVLVQIVLSSSNECMKSKLLDYEESNPERSLSSTDDSEEEIITWNEIYYYSDRPNTGPVDSAWASTSQSISELDVLAYSKEKSYVLIKNLSDTSEQSEYISTKPIHIRRRYFSYQCPDENLKINCFPHKITIFKPCSELSEAMEKDREEEKIKALEENRVLLSKLSRFVSSAICLLFKLIAIKNDKERFKVGLNDLFKKHRNLYEEDDSKKPNMKTFRIECLENAEDTVKSLLEYSEKLSKEIKEYNRSQKKSCLDKDGSGRGIDKSIFRKISSSLSMGRFYIKTDSFQDMFILKTRDDLLDNISTLLKYMIKALPPADSNLQIIGSIIKEIKSIGNRKIYEILEKYLSTIYEEKTTLSTLIEQAKLEYFNELTKKLNEYESKKLIIYHKGIFDEGIKRFFKLYLCFEMEFQLYNPKVAITVCLETVKPELQHMNFKSSLKDLREFQNGFYSNLADQIENIIIVKENGKLEVNEEELEEDIIDKIQKEYKKSLWELYLENKTEQEDVDIWSNPVFMHYNIPLDGNPKKSTLYVIYLNSKDGKIYKKEVKNCIENLKKFSEAKTLRNIESMKGKKEQEISMDELLELEKKELKNISKEEKNTISTQAHRLFLKFKNKIFS